MDGNATPDIRMPDVPTVDLTPAAEQPKQKVSHFFYKFSPLKKILSGVLSVFILTASLGVGLYLVRSRQSLNTEASGAELKLVATNATPKIGDTFQISVYTDSKGLSLTAADLKIAFDGSLLEATAITPGNFFPVVLMPGTISSGSANITLGNALGQPKKGTGIIGTITFRAKALGSSGVSFASESVLTAIGQSTNVAGVYTPVQITVSSSSSTPPPTPSGALPVISNAGVNKNYNPWAVWIQGNNFAITQRARIIDVGGTQWGGDMQIAVNGTTGAAVVLTGNVPPSQCNVGKNCTVSLYLVTSSGGLSNRFNLTLPSTSAPSVTPSPTPIATHGPTPTPTPSQSVPNITNAGVNTVSYDPWAVWMQGKDFNNTQKARVIDVGGGQWGGDFQVGVSGTTGAAFILPSNSPPSGCNIGKTCQVGLYLVTTNGALSNKFNLTLPAK